jgi:hypothetical protein
MLTASDSTVRVVLWLATVTEAGSSPGGHLLVFHPPLILDQEQLRDQCGGFCDLFLSAKRKGSLLDDMAQLRAR